jgi:DNA repair ATPase RecN
MTKKPRQSNKATLGDLKHIAQQSADGRALLALEPTREIGDAFLRSARRTLANEKTTASDRQWLENAMYLYEDAVNGLNADLQKIEYLPENMDKHLLRLAMSISAFAKFGNEPDSVTKKIRRKCMSTAREIKLEKERVIIENCKVFLRKKAKITNSLAFARTIKNQLDADVGADVPVGTIRKRISEVLAER